MIKITNAKDFLRLRRLALASQGLLQTQPFGRGLAGTQNAVNHIGYVQIDTISVVERAHHHVLSSRVPGFKPAMLDKLLQSGDIFEYWSHAAAFLPIEDFRFSLPYKNAIKNGKTHWYKNPDQKLMAELLVRIKQEGPLRSRDIESGSGKKAGWWDWKPAKKALEQLYMQGDLMVSKRDGFQKTYDLAERVLPSSVDTKEPSMDEFAHYLLNQHMRAHGIASIKGLTYLRRNSALRQSMKSLVEEQISAGNLEKIILDNNAEFIIETGALERKQTRVNGRLSILSPFDNAVIQRERLKALFNYDYQIECYVPEAKRQYGYFSLPLLYKDQFIGRMDCKAHRKMRHLEIKSLHFEQHNLDQEKLTDAFIKAIKEFCSFQQCDTALITSANPESLKPQLNLLLGAL